jgi:hypothetical protein
MSWIRCVVCNRRGRTLVSPIQGWVVRLAKVQPLGSTFSRRNWDYYCAKCTRGRGRMTPRYARKKYKCWTCGIMIPFEGYQEHVVKCLASEIEKRKGKQMTATGSSSATSQTTLPAQAHAASL